MEVSLSGVSISAVVVDSAASVVTSGTVVGAQITNATKASDTMT